MTTYPHEFRLLDYNGTPIEVCGLCAQRKDMPTLSEDCAVAKTKAQALANTPPLPPAVPITHADEGSLVSDPIRFLSSLTVESAKMQVAKLEGELAMWRVLLAAVEAREQPERRKVGKHSDEERVKENNADPLPHNNLRAEF